jgi:hypothetical protein
MARIRSIHPGIWTDEAKVARAVCHVYVIQEGEDGPCKVGIARNAFWRRMDLQSGNHRPLHIRHVFEATDRRDAILAEAAAHKHFSQYHISGEWIGVEPDVIAIFLTEEFGDGSH